MEKLPEGGGSPEGQGAVPGMRGAVFTPFSLKESSESHDAWQCADKEFRHASDDIAGIRQAGTGSVLLIDSHPDRRQKFRRIPDFIWQGRGGARHEQRRVFPGGGGDRRSSRVAYGVLLSWAVMPLTPCVQEYGGPGSFHVWYAASVMCRVHAPPPLGKNGKPIRKRELAVLSKRDVDFCSHL